MAEESHKNLDTRSRAEVIDQALVRLTRGESIEVLLTEYSEYASALAPLLRASDRLHAHAATPLPPDLEAWLPTGARDFASVAEQMQTVLADWLPTGARDFAALAEQLAPRYARRRSTGLRPLTLLRIARALAVVAAVLDTADTVTTKSMPGDTLYSWKRIREDVILSLTTGSRDRVRLEMDYVIRRLDELHALIAEPDKVEMELVNESTSQLINLLKIMINEAFIQDKLDALWHVYRVITYVGNMLSGASVQMDDIRQMLNRLQKEIDVVETQIFGVYVESKDNALSHSLGVEIYDRDETLTNIDGYLITDGKNVILRIRAGVSEIERQQGKTVLLAQLTEEGQPNIFFWQAAVDG